MRSSASKSSETVTESDIHPEPQGSSNAAVDRAHFAYSILATLVPQQKPCQRYSCLPAKAVYL